jgi:hypothetical protein
MFFNTSLNIDLRKYIIKLSGQCVFLLDPTPGTANKEERMRCYYYILTQIEENIIKVVRLKHPNYEVKHWHHCITDNVPSCSR